MRLIGDDADLFKADLGEEMTSGTLDAGKEYLVVAVGSGSALAPLWPGCVMKPSGAETLKTGDIVRPLTNVEQMAAVTSWSIELTPTEVDVTALADKTRKYRTGKPDAQGTMRGQFETDAVKAGKGVQNRFFDVIIRKADGSVDVVSKQNGAFLIKGYLQANDVPGVDKIFTFAEIEVGTMSLGADLGAAQEFNGSFRLAGGLDLALYFEEA